jgi:inosine-uridine nucleoside N-ribohydrolase
MKFLIHKKITYIALCQISILCADKKMVIIDTDVGGDDAFALLLATHDERLDVRAITTTYGNADLQQTTNNAAYVLQRFGIQHIPLYSGADKPLTRKFTKDDFWDTTGLGAIKDLKSYALSHNAVQRMLRLIKKHPKKITILALGPLTTIAQAIKKNPRVMAQVYEIIVFAGNLGTMTELSRPEFNVALDPEAAETVFKSGIPVKIITFDTAVRLHITWADLLNCSPPRVNDFIHQMLATNEQKMLADCVYDPLVIYAASCAVPSIPISISIIMTHSGKNNIGQTSGKPCSGHCTISHIEALNKDALIAYFTRTLQKLF